MPSLTIDIEARLAKFQDGLDQVARNAGRTARQIDGAFSGLKSTLVGLGAGLTVGAIAGSIKQTIVDMSELNDAAAQAGISVESLSSLLNTLKPTGVGLPEIVDLTGKIVKAMQQAESATSAQAIAFKALGVATRDSAGNLRGADRVLSDVAAAMALYQDDANKVAIAQALLSKTGASYLPILGDLASRGRAAASVTKEQAQAADDLVDRIGDLTTAFTILRQELVAGVVPALSDFFTRYIALAKLGKGPVDIVEGLFGDSPLEKIAGFERRMAELTRIREHLAKEGDPSVLQRMFNPALRTRDDIDQELTSLAGKVEEARQVQRQMDALFGKPQSGARAPTPGIGAAGAVARTTTEAARAFEDFEARVNAAVAKLLEDTPIVKARELTAQLGKLDELFRLGVDPGIYGQAVGSALTNMAQSGGDASLAISELYKRFGAGKISAGQFAETLEAITKITDKTGKEDKDTLEQLANKWRDLIDPTRKYLKELEEIKLLEGTLSGGELRRALDNIQRRRSEEAEKTNDVLKEQTDIAKDLGLTFSSAFEDAISGGKGLRDIISGIESDIIKLVTRQLVTKPFASWMESALPSILGSMSFGSGAPISASVASTVIPRAAGGPVSVGGSYLVGERAPELFVPKVAGDIVPIGLGGTSVQMTVVTQDAESFRRSEGQIASRLSGALSRGGRFR